MVITYHGGACFKVSLGETVLAFNPAAKESDLKSPRFGADIVFISTQHEDFNGVEQMQNNGKDPFIIEGPGEYEVQDIVVRGVRSSSAYKGTERINTIYRTTLDGMNILNLGALNTTELSPEVRELFSDIDIVFLPIGNDGILDPEAASKLAVKIEPRIIIPMLYDTADDTQKGSGKKKSDTDALTTFLREEGVEQREAVDKLTVKPKDVAGKNGEIAVLKAQ